MYQLSNQGISLDPCLINWVNVAASVMRDY